MDLSGLLWAVEHLGQTFTGLAAFVLSLYLLRQQTSASRIATHEAMLESFNSFIRFGLSSDETFAAVKKTFYHDFDDAELKQFWAVLMAMNTLEHVVVAKRYKGLDTALADGILARLMTELLRQPLTERVLSRGTIDAELIVLAKRLKAEGKRVSAAQQQVEK
jgi:hypothetical protein